MTTTPALVPTDRAVTLPSPEVVETVLLGGDLAKLSPAQRVAYYKSVCDSLKLNALTRPFEYLTLSGRLVLYARRDAAEQLRRINGVSIIGLEKTFHQDLYLVTATARDASGRTDVSTGAVSIANLKGEALANALMKAETKSKRRVTLSITGLGVLDESELETIPDARPLDVDPTTGEIRETAAQRDPGITRISSAQRTRWHAVKRAHNWSDEQAKDLLLRKYGLRSTSAITVAVYDKTIADLEAGPPATPAAVEEQPF
jgi:hypothetical protein